MSNPTGDALVAIEIKDTQKLSGRAIQLRSGHARTSSWSDAYQICLGMAVCVFLMAFLLI